MRAIRGAITVNENERDSILSATKKMLEEIISRNRLNKEQIISMIFSVTGDLTKVQPAVAAREMGFETQGLFCVAEMSAENSLPLCIRVLIHAEIDVLQKEICHVYLKGAKILRPDLSEKKEDKCLAIAIDGPSGAGKSTIAQLLAKELKYIYIDTGAMYRSVALYCLNNGVDLSNKEKVESLLDNISIEITHIDGMQHLILNGEDVTERLRVQEVAGGASIVAAIPGVRRFLTEIQKEMADKANVVMDGRDIGTFVLPGAGVKIYMDADPDIRAQRRTSELAGKGIHADKEQIKSEIIQRDIDDKNREHSPLTQAEDAIYIDTSKLSKNEVVNMILKIVQERQ